MHEERRGQRVRQEQEWKRPLEGQRDPDTGDFQHDSYEPNAASGNGRGLMQYHEALEVDVSEPELKEEGGHRSRRFERRMKLLPKALLAQPTPGGRDHARRSLFDANNGEEDEDEIAKPYESCMFVNLYKRTTSC